MIENTTPANRRRPILLVFLIAANLLMLAVGIITIPPNLREKDELNKVAFNRETTRTEAGRANDNKPEGADAPDLSKADEAVPVNLSTEERPDLDDFLWYTESVFYDGMPADAEGIKSLEQLSGNWKGLIIYDPDNAYGANAMEFLNVNLAGTPDNLSLTLDWYMMFIAGEGESWDETDMEDVVFNGKWEAEGLWASGAGTVRLTKFYAANGKQYAVGTMDTPDGIPAFMALVRP